MMTELLGWIPNLLDPTLMMNAMLQQMVYVTSSELLRFLCVKMMGHVDVSERPTDCSNEDEFRLAVLFYPRVQAS